MCWQFLVLNPLLPLTCYHITIGPIVQYYCTIGLNKFILLVKISVRSADSRTVALHKLHGCTNFSTTVYHNSMKQIRGLQYNYCLIQMYSNNSHFMFWFIFLLCHLYEVWYTVNNSYTCTLQNVNENSMFNFSTSLSVHYCRYCTTTAGTGYVLTNVLRFSWPISRPPFCIKFRRCTTVPSKAYLPFSAILCWTSKAT